MPFQCVSPPQMPYTDVTEIGEEVTFPHIVGRNGHLVFVYSVGRSWCCRNVEVSWARGQHTLASPLNPPHKGTLPPPCCVVAGIQSPDQMELLAKHNPSRPLFVEGPFPLWLRGTCVYYYILRADPLPPGEKVTMFISTVYLFSER